MPAGGKRQFPSRQDGAARADFKRSGWMPALTAAALTAFWEKLSPGAFDGLDGWVAKVTRSAGSLGQQYLWAGGLQLGNRGQAHQLQGDGGFGR